MPVAPGAAGPALPLVPGPTGLRPCPFAFAEKPGTCPPVSPGIPMLGVCTNQCKTDSNCSGSQKCCRNGCGKVSCVTPLH
ncbi:hypothetical protein QYF61_022029 [Mycteria americana]|uniref:WAP domain-containing protein n=1 Tax=Mycteria americana TaxID=33587 RepID=A0AAN7MSQ7_MYCAM|nr:hypothetical protein QYF61_022029 [Mycteria americana]